MKNKFKLYGEFTKVEEQEDGTLKVSGVASSEATDSEGEIVTAEAMKAALPDYLKFGALREMHQAWAAGTAIKAEVDDENRTQFEALVVDSEAIKKVQTGTYKGFSIGGKVTERDPANKNIIKGIKLVEVSLVDRPANPEAVFSLGKVEGDETATLGELRKGMYEVQDFAAALRCIGYLAQSAANEAEWEGDASPVPAALRDWLAQGAAIFQAMAKEELDELLASLPAPPSVEVMELAAKLAKAGGIEEYITSEELAKVGAKWSKATKALLAEVHKGMKDCCDKMAALGYDKEDADMEEADKADPSEALQKAEALAKVADLEAQLAKAATEKADLAKRVAELEAQPSAPKGPLRVIGKGEDIGAHQVDADLEKQAQEIDKLPPHQQALALTRVIHMHHRTGGQS